VVLVEEHQRVAGLSSATTAVCWKAVSAGLAVGTLSVQASWIGQ
jgi:hypothetical protein